MPDQSLAQQIAQLRSQLNTVDTQLARSTGATEGLEDLKSAVDSLRTNVWAVLSASRSSNYPAFITRFRLRRGLDTLKAVLQDLEQEGGQQLYPEHSELQILMQQLHEKIGRLRHHG